MVKGTYKRSLFWTVFTKTAPNRAKCNFCGKECSYIGGTTSNLARHLRSAHPDIKLSPPQYRESEATTLIITAQTSSDGSCIATIEPFEVTTKSEPPDDCEGATLLNGSQNQLPEGVKKKRSACWSIFRKLDENRVLCRHCGHTLSAPKGATSNLNRHLKTKHQNLYSSLQIDEIKKKKVVKFKQSFSRGQSKQRLKTSASHLSVPQEAEMPEDIQKFIHETREKEGFVPNAYHALSHRPNEMRAFLAYYDTVMEDRVGGHLTRCDKEMIFIAVSSFNKCKYFIISHSGLLRLHSHNKLLADQIAANWESADIDERQRSILGFALKVTKCEALMENDFNDLANHGLDSEDAWDIGSIVSICSLSNRMAYLTNMTPNEEFYSLGRS
ncbi:uncharacterized protein LOC106061691 [Biomphalaria glabrata]|uniref:Uncharacterized protein LOC106061691 n=1 Tax=Biomphalaria glabrata TaxID=6526 RepID=A0A9W3B173_BIOGL|nr:uncharacterized protein LOC106061691 [Biomphalaria glabrata]XP_055893211.1 uncharacterized protein LOC106061691 [Biomphalaria glabrata]